MLVTVRVGAPELRGELGDSVLVSLGLEGGELLVVSGFEIGVVFALSTAGRLGHGA